MEEHFLGPLNQSNSIVYYGRRLPDGSQKCEKAATHQTEVAATYPQLLSGHHSIFCLMTRSLVFRKSQQATTSIVRLTSNQIRLLTS
jgi:hypothetical protein